MSLKHNKHWSHTHSDYSYRPQNLPLTDNFGKRSVRTFVDFRHTNMPEGLDIKGFPLLCLVNLSCVSKVKVISFLVGLVLMFLIMASYLLMWDRKGLLLSEFPRPFRPVVIMTGATTAEDSLDRSFIDVKTLVKMINSNEQNTSRKIPDEKDVINTDPHFFSVIPRHFLPHVKSPCWYEELSGDLGTDPYKNNRFSLRSKSFKNVCDHMRARFHQNVCDIDGKRFRLRCLPYFYIIGQPKCGTTDLFHRLLMLPELKFNTIKEPHWWTRKRFGYIRFKKGFQERFPIEDYLDLFDLAAINIQVGISGNSSGDHRANEIITGEASASTMWDNQAWSYLHGNEEQTEPPFLAQDFIHAVQPGAKIIIMLRDPVERLYSDYLYFTLANKSAEDFHQKVVECVQLFQSCLSERSLRSCVYNTSLFNAMPVRLTLGMYFVFVLDWLTVFQREQILVLQLEDYAANLRKTLKTVFDFLGVGPLSEQVEASLTKRPMSNTRRAKDRILGPMMPATRNLLSQFYQPFNSKLANILNKKAFLWSYS
ncbi:PREDICTED: carbohydrate sulfotransferase 15-like [Poecilia mexicana]|uniref:Sulfotransferase n=1 Tax=Poecilia mexicana TaxID=48701 RepID=A0A3B3X2R7_9TELE|nr:PREDICTED: carbohydrate sulfotransferase 15-like [Poecilia mexicana]XP_014823435.1 PREDICTED: carbohydrate sulfotransferase 15-like [Poecilia mexicana]